MTNAERAAGALFRYRLISLLRAPALTPGDRHAYPGVLAAHPPTLPPDVPAARSRRRYPAT